MGGLQRPQDSPVASLVRFADSEVALRATLRGVGGKVLENVTYFLQKRLTGLSSVTG